MQKESFGRICSLRHGSKNGVRKEKLIKRNDEDNMRGGVERKKEEDGRVG